MGKFLERRWSGYSRNWEEISGGMEAFELTLLDARTGKRYDLGSDDLTYWMASPISKIFVALEDGWLNDFERV